MRFLLLLALQTLIERTLSSSKRLSKYSDLVNKTELAALLLLLLSRWKYFPKRWKN